MLYSVAMRQNHSPHWAAANDYDIVFRMEIVLTRIHGWYRVIAARRLESCCYYCKNHNDVSWRKKQRICLARMS